MENVKTEIKENLDVFFPLINQKFHFDLALIVNNKIISIGCRFRTRQYSFNS